MIAPDATRRGAMAFYELRQYKVLPGKMDAWVKIMDLDRFDLV